MTHPAIDDFDSQNDPFGTLIKLIETLRGDQGCPWDRKQTPKSIAVYLIEEVFELTDAIASGDTSEICEELGDVLFQLFFIAGIFSDRGSFDILAVIKNNVEKMVRRHPHVFGPEKAQNTEQIRERWHKIKQQEKAVDKNRSAIDSVPANLPALLRAFRISERAARTGFDWPDTAGVIDKVEEEWAELKSAIESQDARQADREFGDLLFTLVNLARFIRIHPETSLSEAITKFAKRFKMLEKMALESGGGIETLSPQQLDEIWETVKGRENQNSFDP